MAEVVLGAALAAALVGPTALLVSGATDQATSPAHPAATTHPVRTTAPKRPHRSHQASALPAAAAAAAAFVGELEAGVADGQVTPQAGQDLYNHLQQLLFGPPGHAQQIQHQYAQLLQAYQQHRSQGQVTGRAATDLRHALAALGTAIGAS
jgi:eukaryotic-like serine/threonine-protein kinase